MNRRLGILGGTFDPIHCGHLDLGAAAQAALGLEALLVMPLNVPPHRAAPVASAFHRFAMVAISIAGRSGWRASDLELRRQEPSYTSSTLRHLHDAGYQPHELFFVLGADAFAEIGIWKDYPQILERANFVVVSRPGNPVSALPARLPDLASRMVRVNADDERPSAPSVLLVDGHTADISGTSVRRRAAERLSLTGMVVPGVEQHIQQHGLYRATLSSTPTV